MINHRNENRTDHILTIEEPIEFYHPNLKGIVSQREVGVDTLSYASALKASFKCLISLHFFKLRFGAFVRNL